MSKLIMAVVMAALLALGATSAIAAPATLAPCGALFERPDNNSVTQNGETNFKPCGDLVELGETEVCPDGSVVPSGTPCPIEDADGDLIPDEEDLDDDNDSQPDWCDPSPLVNDGNQSFDCMF